MSSSHILILIVDDEPDLCALSKQFLESSGELQADTAGSVREARVLLAQNRYEAIVSDYQMPVEDGIQFLKSLRAAGDRTPFILFTGRGREEVVIEAVNNGADAYIQKGGKTVPQYTELSHRIISLVRRQRAEEALIRSEEKHRIYITHSSTPFAVVDPTSRYVDVNQAICGLLGYSRQEMLGMGVDQIIAQEEMPDLASGSVALQGQDQATQVMRLRKKDGNYISAIIDAVRLPDETSMAFFTDITKLREYDLKVSRLNRELVAIKECHRAIVRARTEQELLDEVCRIVCEVAGYRMAWIGMAEDDDRRSVSPAALGGYDQGYVARAKATWGEDDRGRGPVGMCIKSGAPVFIQDLAEDGRMSPWKESAIENGYRSTIALPLLDSGLVFGAFMLYSGFVNGFTGEEIELLEEMATDLAHGITGLRDQEEKARAEEAMRISDARFRTLFEVNNDATLVVDLEDGHIIDVNPAATRMYGYAKEELIGLDIDIIVPDLEGTRQIQGSGKKFIPIRYHRRREGPSFPAEITTSRFMANGRTMLVVTVRDISGRLQAEDALRESEKRFQNLADNTFEGIWVSIDGIITDVNKTLAELLGYRPDELIGRRSAEMFASPSVNTTADQRRPEVPGPYEAEITSKNGDVLTVQIQEKKIIWKGRPARFGALLDITAKKATETALRASEDKFRSIFELSPVAIGISRNSITTYVNPPYLEMFGFQSPDELIGHSLLEQIAPQCRDEVTEWVSRRAKGMPVEKEKDTSGLRKDGSQFQFRVVVSRVSLDGSIASVGFFTDITDLLRDREREKGMLRESEDRFRLLYENSLDAVLLTRPDGSILSTNPAACLMFQATEEEMIKAGRDGTVVHNDQLDRALREREVKGRLKAELTFTRGNGETFIGETTSSLFTDADGSVKTSMIIRDITERRRAEESLRLSDERFKALFDALGDAAWVIDLRTNRIIDVNPAAARLYGYSREEFIGLCILDISAEPEETNRPVLHDGSAFIPLRHHRRKDGTIFPAEITISAFEIGGRPTSIGTVRDISVKMETEHALMSSESKFKGLFAAISEGLVVVDRQTGAIIDCNDAFERMYGYRKEELIGLPNTVTSAEPELTEISTRKGERYIPMRLHRRKGGSTFPVEIMTNIMDLNGREVIVGAVRDITEKRSVEKALRNANHKLNLLSSITRHDINNQTAALEGHLALLEMDNAQLSSDDHLKKAKMAARRISAMIRFTKEYEDIGIDAPTWQDVRGLAESVSKEMLLGGVSLIDDVPMGTAILADPLIVKVFHNLIQNSLRHGGKVTAIRFTVENIGGHQAIICEDDGSGIPAAKKMQLFTKGGGRDHGLGLFLSKEILSITGITITEEGEPGKGARFVMIVPSEGMRRSGP